MARGVQNDISDLIVNTDVMAEAFGFTRQRINQLAKEGILAKNSPGRFPLLYNVKKFLEYTRTGLKPDDDEATARYWEEKALHEKARREITELKLAKIKNQLHEAADIEIVLTGMLSIFRSRILGVPSKVSPRLLGLKSLALINEVIQEELVEVLTELSEYDPSMFVEGDTVEEEDEDTISEDT